MMQVTNWQQHCRGRFKPLEVSRGTQSSGIYIITRPRHAGRRQSGIDCTVTGEKTCYLAQPYCGARIDFEHQLARIIVRLSGPRPQKIGPSLRGDRNPSNFPRESRSSGPVLAIPMADANPKIVQGPPQDVQFNQLFLYINECNLGRSAIAYSGPACKYLRLTSASDVHL
jgi:hypothetical protein